MGVSSSPADIAQVPHAQSESPNDAAGMGAPLDTTLLVAGITSSVLYIGLMIVASRLWPEYDSASQTVSELSAVGAPTRALWLPLGALYTVLVTAFGWGVWRSAGDERSIRLVGVLIIAYGALGILWPFAPMHMREVLARGGATTSDTMHLVLGGVTVALMLVAIAAGAAAFGRVFRVYSIVSLVTVFVFGALTGSAAPKVGANLPTPWVGVWERVNIGVFLLWVVVLAVLLLRPLMWRESARSW